MMTLIQNKQIRPIWWGAVVLLWTGFILLNWTLFMYGDTSAFGRYDYLAYAKGAQALIDGLSPYRPQFDARHLYLYPPLLAQLLMPFIATLGERLTAILWFCLNIACIIGTIQIMRRYTAPQHHIWLWLFPIIFTPFIHTLDLGQVTVIMMFIFMLIWHEWHHNRKIVAGMWLALLCWFKVYPAFVVIYFIIKRDWRVIYGVVIAGVGLGLGQVVVSGLDTLVESFQVLFTLFDEGQNDGLFKNSSLIGFTARMFTEHPMIIPLVVDDALFTLSRYLLIGFTILITFGAILKYQHPSFDLEYGAILLMALMIPNTFWISGMPPYFVIFWLILRHSKGLYAGIVFVCFVALSLYFPLLVNSGNERLPWWGIFSMGFYASFTLWGMLVYRLIRR